MDQLLSLRVFTRIADAGTFVKDAESLKLPPSTVTKPEIEVILGVSERNVDLIGDGVDCVIRGNPLTASSLIARRIAEIGYVTCASPSYLREHGVPSEERRQSKVHDFVRARRTPLPPKVLSLRRSPKRHRKWWPHTACRRPSS